MNNPTPLSPEEVAARDARARELGIRPPTPDEDGPYGSLAEAQAAGMPDQPRPTQAELDAHNGADFGLLAPQRVVRLSAPPSQPPATGPMVKLPDFRKVEGFDFFRNVLYIDGLEFAIPEADVRGMKQYAVDLALDHVVKQLAAALVEFGVPPELANQTADSVRGSVHETSTGPGEGTSSDAGAERQPDGGDQAAEGSPRAE
jgi:hypothetical protein